MSDPTLDTTDPDPAEAGCTWCERTSGMVLIIGAAALAYIGLDMLTGGWLSRMFISGVNRAADAIDVPEETEVSSEPATST